MPTKRKKISALPVTTSLEGLHTIGVDALNKSVKVSLEFVGTAADNAENAAIKAQAAANNADGVVAGIQARFDAKVDKVAGKGLSANDYTDLDVAEVRKIGSKEDAQIVKSVSGSSVTLDVLGGHTYLCGELASLSFGAIEDSARESVIFFRSGARATTVAWPEQLKVVGYKVPAANKSYEVSIRRGLAVIVWSE